MTKRRLADPAAASQPLPETETEAQSPEQTAQQTAEAVREVVAAALDKKAEDLKVLEVGELTHFTDYFLVCSGQNPRQVQAIADGVERRLREHKLRPSHVEGYQSGQWVLMDYGDFVLHVFLQERRRFYGLERLWGDAPDLTADFVADAAAREQSSARQLS
ncbi:MAG TPA: ribosome silencing factor [Thermoanaerobaculia bacterium]|jgi:ribosome-associated protein|nr:ribosome silencing factor [Thermoanaerobaculia bacterium]